MAWMVALKINECKIIYCSENVCFIKCVFFSSIEEKRNVFSENFKQKIFSRKKKLFNRACFKSNRLAKTKSLSQIDGIKKKKRTKPIFIHNISTICVNWLFLLIHLKYELVVKSYMTKSGAKSRYNIFTHTVSVCGKVKNNSLSAKFIE